MSVKVIDDSVEDDGETMELAISSMVYTTGTGSEIKNYELPKIKNGIGTIRNSEEDPPADASVLSVADAEATEGDTMHFVVTLDPAETVRVTVDYHTTNLGFEYTASSGSDYTVANGTLTFEPGEITKTVSVQTLADEVEDDGETFLLYLGNPVNAQDGGGGVGTIRDVSANTPAAGVPTVSGTAQVGETLTAATSAIADADGLDDVTYSYQWIVNDGNADADIKGATGSTYTPVDDDVGKTIKVKVTFTDDGGTQETLTSVATDPIAAVLTASFADMPAEHGGGGASNRFAFKLSFSENVRTGWRKLKERAFVVSGGHIEQVRRKARGDGSKNQHWTIWIEPTGAGDVTITLPGGRACGAANAICTFDDRPISNSPSARVPGPAALPAVSVAGGASPVMEGAGVAFTLTRTGDVSAALTVAVEVTETGAMLAGDAPTEVTFEAASATASLTLATVDDEAAEAASVLAVTVASGDGYTVASQGASAELTVEDDDAAPEVTTGLALAVPENATSVATLEATDTDTGGEDLAWSISGGADAGVFALTEAGVLTFRASKDFEAPDDADGDGTYEVTVRVTDGANPVDAALTVSLTDVDEIAPALAAASVNGAALTLTFSEALDADSKPAAGAFAVTVAGEARTVDAVSLSGSAVTLTLASAVASDETVTVCAIATRGSATGAFASFATTSSAAATRTSPTIRLSGLSIATCARRRRCAMRWASVWSICTAILGVPGSGSSTR